MVYRPMLAGLQQSRRHKVSLLSRLKKDNIISFCRECSSSCSLDMVGLHFMIMIKFQKVLLFFRIAMNVSRIWLTNRVA
jgi:hypothetical protein